MSLSNPNVNKSNSPVSRYYYWSGEKGRLTYWDKEKSEKVVYDDEFSFILIEQLNCVEGYSAKQNDGFRSNEVKSTQKEPLHLRWNSSGKTLVEGLYADIKPTIESSGGSYFISLYGIQNIEGEWLTVNIRLKGSGLSSWINFDKSSKVTKIGLTIRIISSELKRNGAVKYFEPRFIASNTDEKTHALAFEADVCLQEHFKSKTTKPEADVDTTPLTPDEFLQLKKPKPNSQTFSEVDDIFNL